MSTPKSSLNTGRSSPFRRPASPLSQTPSTGRSSTPPSRTAPSPMTSPSKLKHSFTASEEDDYENEDEDLFPTPTRSNMDPMTKGRAQTEPPSSPSARRLHPTTTTSSPTKQAQFSNPIPTPSPLNSRPQTATRITSLSQNDNLSKLPAQLLHSMRESFSVLDSESNGYIDAASVSETFQSLGIQESNISQFFPPGQASQLSLPQYLNQLANILVNLSPQQELLNAFSAFDDDDSGQVDVAELRHALLNTAPDAGERPLTEKDLDRALNGYTGRRILGKNAIGIAGVRGLNTPAQKKTGDVFRYQEFVGNLMGGSATESSSSVGSSHHHVQMPPSMITGKAFP